ncbi:MAG TPA: YihY/virulence factor BrkB family protein [Patescibacteria group bacterium]|nr:YihY/virulence factor BrkB family protein [Patescibacteria group bacterium]
MTLYKLTKRLRDKLWEASFKPGTVTGRFGLRMLRLGIAVARDIHEGDYGQRAASLAYTTLVSFVPVLAIAFSVLKGFGVHDALLPSLKAFLAPLGPVSIELADRIVGFVENINVGVLGAVGTAFLIFGVVSTMQKTENAFNEIWRVLKGRTFFKRVRDYMAVVLAGPLLMFLSIAMSATLEHADVAWKWLHIDLVDSTMEHVFSVVPWVLFILAFAALYGFMPNARVKPLCALAAGATVSLVWKFLGAVFGLFVATSTSYAAIYSAFAALILFMIWVYVGWFTLLAGAAVSYYLQHPTNQGLSRHIKNLSVRVKEKIALQVCHDIGRAFYKDGKGIDLQHLASGLKMPALAVLDVIEDLSDQGILAATGTGAPHFIPGRPFDTTTIEDLLKAIRAADETPILRVDRVHGSPGVNTVVKLLDKALHDKLGKYTLKQLATGSIEA